MLFQDSRGEGVLAGEPVPRDEGAVRTQVLPPRVLVVPLLVVVVLVVVIGEGDAAAARQRAGRAAALPPPVGRHRQVHGVRAALQHDQEEVQLQGLRSGQSNT